MRHKKKKHLTNVANMTDPCFSNIGWRCGEVRFAIGMFSVGKTSHIASFTEVTAFTGRQLA